MMKETQISARMKSTTGTLASVSTEMILPMFSYVFRGRHARKLLEG
jgi:hypothetical protein